VALRTNLEGVWVTLVTPFGDDGAIDLDRFAEQVRGLADADIDHLVPAGNTGEYSSLTPSEIVELVSVTREAAPDTVVVAGVGGDLHGARELTARCLAAGADGVMVHHPSHTFVSASGLEAYYRELLAEADGRALLYKRGHVVPDALLARLLDGGAAWGVKYAVNDLVAFDRARRSAPDGLWLCGTAELWAPFFALLGARGFTSGLACVAPRLPLAMDAALRVGDYADAMRLRELAAPFEALRAEDGASKNVPAVRAALTLSGLDVGPPRPPLAALEAGDVERVAAVLGDWREAGLLAVDEAAVG
jgi:4-hydroxy-tetrahydrodipicolinate synthase